MKTDRRGPGRPKIGERVTVRLPAAMLERVDALAEADGITRAEMIRRLALLGLHEHRLA